LVAFSSFILLYAYLLVRRVRPERARDHLEAAKQRLEGEGGLLMCYMVFAYVVIIAAILRYTVRLWLGERSCHRQMEALREVESPR
jgi:hypothetical protein